MVRPFNDEPWHTDATPWRAMEARKRRVTADVRPVSVAPPQERPSRRGCAPAARLCPALQKGEGQLFHQLAVERTEVQLLNRGIGCQGPRVRQTGRRLGRRRKHRRIVHGEDAACEVGRRRDFAAEEAIQP